MTVAIAWIRKVRDYEELVFISDSRLSGGYSWDECPKIITFSRKDCAMCFSGSTDYAYTMMLQISTAIDSFGKLKSGATDIKHLSGMILKHINNLWSSIKENVNPKDIINNNFLFGGYSWVDKKFMLWKYSYNVNRGCFERKRIDGNYFNKFGTIAVIGDKAKQYKSIFLEYLMELYGKQTINYRGKGFDMEPFQALCHMLKTSNKSDSVGGAPQMVKVHQFLNTRPVGIYWPNKTDDEFENRTLLGRKLLAYEDTEYWFLDASTMRTNPCYKIGKDTRNKSANNIEDNNEELPLV